MPQLKEKHPSSAHLTLPSKTPTLIICNKMKAVFYHPLVPLGKISPSKVVQVDQSTCLIPLHAVAIVLP